MAATMTPRDVSSDESSTTTPDVELSSHDDVNKTLARKRRIELRNKQRSSDDSSADDEPAAKRSRGEAAIVVDPVISEETDAKPSITGIKRQHRYDPGVSMTREELKAWRKEARRVRNRESAAASRQKNRERVNELEEEVEALKSKYAAALQWIVKLEAAAAVNDSFTPAILRQDVRETAQSSPCPREDIQTVSPPATPPTSSRIVELGQSSQVDEKYQHIMNMISQPAVFT